MSEYTYSARELSVLAQIARLDEEIFKLHDERAYWYGRLHDDAEA